MGSPVSVVDCVGFAFYFVIVLPPWVRLPLGLPSAVAFGCPWGGWLGPCWGLASFPPWAPLFAVLTKVSARSSNGYKEFWTEASLPLAVAMVGSSLAPVNGSGAPLRLHGAPSTRQEISV